MKIFFTTVGVFFFNLKNIDCSDFFFVKYETFSGGFQTLCKSIHSQHIFSGSHVHLTSAFMVYFAEPSQVVRIGAQRHGFQRERRFKSCKRKRYHRSNNHSCWYLVEIQRLLHYILHALDSVFDNWCIAISSTLLP